jgi:hypothetical protein
MIQLDQYEFGFQQHTKDAGALIIYIVAKFSLFCSPWKVKYSIYSSYVNVQVLEVVCDAVV